MQDNAENACQLSTLLDFDELSSNGHGVSQEKKSRRLEKNREAARASRRRKRQHVEDIEATVNRVEEDNARLRLEAKLGKQAASKDDTLSFCNNLESMISSNGEDEQLKQTLKEYQERHAEYGKDRRSAVKYHIEQLGDLMLPTMTTKMILWVLQQDGTFRESAQAQCSLSGKLLRELDVSQQQIEEFQQHKEEIKTLSTDLHDSIRMVQDLKGMLDEKHESLGIQMAKIQQILTPTQIAKFTLWVKNNAACMAMLARLWNQIGGDDLSSNDESSDDGASASSKASSSSSSSSSSNSSSSSEPSS